MRQGYVMLLLLFNIFMDMCKTEIVAKVENVSKGLKMDGIDWGVEACLFADNCCLLSEEELQSCG